jgi:hypothetical protein
LKTKSVSGGGSRAPWPEARPGQKGLAMKALTKEERRVVARRLFEALRVHYPNRYISLIERPASTKLMIVGGTAIQSTMTIAASKAAPPALRAAAPRVES